jgi:alkanesulfonate monooxygenase SsuD/methylene tetrahydromethanopterin reductase-like flavin-dependent oxidoreductase (luciferase family)
VDAAQQAEREGIDGVYCFDHLWPLGRRPGAPAAECLTLLAAVAAATERIRVGTLVMRAGLRPPEVAVAGLRTVAAIAPGRLVAGLGSGDSMNEEENSRFGIPFAPVAARLDWMHTVATALMEEGIEVWIGGLGPQVRQLAHDLGATWNCWALTDAQLRAALEEIPQRAVTWGGLREPPPFSVPVEELFVARRWADDSEPDEAQAT